MKVEKLNVKEKVEASIKEDKKKIREKKQTARTKKRDPAEIIGIGFFIVGVIAWALSQYAGFPFIITFIVTGILALLLWKLNYVIGYTKLTIEFIKDVIGR